VGIDLEGRFKDMASGVDMCGACDLVKCLETHFFGPHIDGFVIAMPQPNVA
jgi:hypothetical protein